jgi:hypothetical protein
MIGRGLISDPFFAKHDKAGYFVYHPKKQD